MKPHTIHRRAIKIEQQRGHPLYLFSLTAAELLQIADISRVSRGNAGQLIGYQRPEVRRHVRNIVDYLNGPDVLFPNSIILALSSGCRFSAVRGPKVEEGPSVAGTLRIPVGKAGQPKPAWIVDGQQRALALSQAKRQTFPVPVNAFVADDVELQRDQFLRVNSTKPLPRGLITELLPEVSTVLPPHLALRKAAASLCDLLNRSPDSPFKGLIRHSSMDKATKQRAIVPDTVIVRMLEDSLTSPSGCLFPFRDIANGQTDYDGVQRVLHMYWAAVRDVFKDAWGLPHEKSRLLHSAGVLAMGRLMDKVMGPIDLSDPKASQLVRADLQRIKPICRWTGGVWEEMGDRAWDDLQNLHRDVSMLSSVLIRALANVRRTAA